MKGKQIFKLLFKTVKWGFIVFCVFLLSLFFREQALPANALTSLATSFLPTNLVFHADRVTFGFRHGIHIEHLRLYDRSNANEPLVKADRLAVSFFPRVVEIDALTYRRLPDSYYAPENIERNGALDVVLPTIPRFALILNRPDILSVTPTRVVTDVEVARDYIDFSRCHLDWPDQDARMELNGFCRVDLRTQEVVGDVRGQAKQRHIRPLLVALDVPVSLPYMDGFTDVPGPVIASCAWHVNLVNNDFDLDLDLHPPMGKYNTVPLASAEGKIHLHVYTRGTSLNYSHVFGPIVGQGLKGEPIEGTVRVNGLNGTNTVDVVAKSALPVAQLLKIGGFTGDYVDEEVVGDSSCTLFFHFPRTMTDTSTLNGHGHLEIRDGQILRLRGFKGLIELLAEKVPGVSWFTDTTQASGDYVIENGLVKSDNIYIEGTVFSLKMYGTFDSVRDVLDFTVRVQFTKKDSVAGKILHPLAWPFTKLLLEFRLTGSTTQPKWTYVSVIDRVMEVAK